jgi:hypothetical protein
MSTECKGSRVSSAKRLASVDFPPPAFPNTATLLMAHARQHITVTGSLWITGALGEIVRVGRGRYGPLRARSRAVAPRADVAAAKGMENFHPLKEATAPAANGVSHGAKDANGSQQYQAAKPAPRIAADPGVSLRNELARELFERRLGIEDDPVEAPRAAISFETFVATVAGKYVKAGLCPPPPLRLRSLASAWIASGIDPAHCLTVVDRFLREHAPSRRSGSLDGLLPYLDKLIRFEWNRAQHTRRAELKT